MANGGLTTPVTHVTANKLNVSWPIRQIETASCGANVGGEPRREHAYEKTARFMRAVLFVRSCDQNRLSRLTYPQGALSTLGPTAVPMLPKLQSAMVIADTRGGVFAVALTPM